MPLHTKTITVCEAEHDAIAREVQTFLVVDNAKLLLQPAEMLGIQSEQGGETLTVRIKYISTVGVLPGHIACAITRVDNMEIRHQMGMTMTSVDSQQQFMLNKPKWQRQGFESVAELEEYQALMRVAKEGERTKASIRAQEAARDAREKMSLINQRREARLKGDTNA